MKKLTGVIVFDKMNKTRRVEINKVKRHPIYRKAFKVSTRIQAHDENNLFKTGDTVEIEAIKPISRKKAWKIIRKIND